MVHLRATVIESEIRWLLRGGECGKVELNMFGDPETEDEGEKVGNGEVERDLFGCSSTCELRVRLSVPIF